MLKELMMTIVSVPEVHARWLNTLSYLENCGARKIAACEHPTLVREEMLKHAAEEFRHAHHLKRQMEKVLPRTFDTYALPYLLGGVATLHYLSALDIKTSRYLKNLNFSKQRIKEAAYLLVTYAIELRAKELYPIYDEVLRLSHSTVSVKSIIWEENEHLKEMEQALCEFPSGFVYAQQICAIEANLYAKWLNAISLFSKKDYIF